MTDSFEQRLSQADPQTRDLFFHKLRMCPVEEAFDLLSHAGLPFEMWEVVAYKQRLFSLPSRSVEPLQSSIEDQESSIQNPVSIQETTGQPSVSSIQDGVAPLSTINHQPSATAPAAHAHRRTGKIARLPAAIREQVNEFIDDGMEYPRIIQWLANNGHPGISPANLTNWRQGGFEDWLTYRQRLDELELKLQCASDFARQADLATFHQAAMNLTFLQFFETLNRFDTRDLSTSLQARPDRYPTLINSLCRFSREFITYERFRAEQQERAAAEADRKKAGEAHGLTPETVNEILRALRFRYPQHLQHPANASSPEPSEPICI